MDVALGVAVTDRVARLALVDSAAPGTVIDQFVLDVAEHPVEVLTETVVGTDRSLAGETTGWSLPGCVGRIRPKLTSCSTHCRTPGSTTLP